jgi:5-methyltetrahydrofolate--homocysteine methyltransferase
MRSLKDELTKRILVLDGAMGTQIQSFGLSEEDFRGDRYARHKRDLKGDNEVLSLTRPDVIERIHKSYLEAGADIISTNTLNGSSVSQSHFGTDGDVYGMNLAAARIARSAADELASRDPSRPRFVAGVLGPTSKTCSISPSVDSPGYRDITFDRIAAAYKDQASALIDGGVDVLMVETVFDTLNAKAALFAVRRALDELGTDVPVWISATVGGAGGRMLTGQTVEAFWISVRHAEPLCVGLNCGMGAEAIRPHLAELSRKADTFVSVHPNAGLPNEFGEYDESPARMAATLGGFAEEGLVNIVGGCCGSTPEHIAAIARELEGAAPRRPPAPPEYTFLSGLEPLEIRPDSLFINVGERTNLTGSARFARLIKEGRGEGALEVARDQIRGGAQIIDVNMDDPLLDSVSEMTKFLNLAASDPEINRVPVMIDSASWDVIEAGLKCLLGKGVVNSISLKDGEDEFIRKARLVRRYGAAAVIMAFDENGQAEDYRRKVDICTRAYAILTERVGFSARDIILDPGIFAVGTGMPGQDNHGVAFIEACRTIKETLPGCLVSGGVSNLSFAFRGNDVIRGAMHSVFLYHAVRAGMDMGIVNAGQLVVYEEIPLDLRRAVEDLILNRRPDALRDVMDLARRTRDKGAAAKTPDTARRAAPVSQRLEHALVNGVSDYVEEDALEALEELGDPVRVIEGPLMAGMEAVGELFGAGKMFLPQVVRSARVMKKAVLALEPYLKDDGDRWDVSRQGPGEGGASRRGAGAGETRGGVRESGAPRGAGVSGPRVPAHAPRAGAKSQRSAPPKAPRKADSRGGGTSARDAGSAGKSPAGAKPKVLLATVKGDVHDIGKNIVAVVLSCNNYQVTDLGVGVTAEEICQAAEREEADAIGLSGLITPSLEQMCVVAGELERRGFTTPLLIGGATTSRAHTALKIDPLYSGPVLHVSDASRAVTAVAFLLGKGARAGSVRDIKDEYARVRREVEERRAAAELIPLSEARRRRKRINWKGFRPSRPRYPGVTAFDDYPLADIAPFIDWGPFYRVWKLSGRHPEILESDRFGEEARRLFGDAQALLKRIIHERLLCARAVLGLFAANSVGDDIELYAYGDPSRFLSVIHCLRQQGERPPGGSNLCLSDFVAPKETGLTDYVGAFVVSAGFGAGRLSGGFESKGDDYSGIMAKALADRLAEAFAEHLHSRVRREFWGYAPDEDLSMEAAAAEEYIGIRPAPGYPACPDHAEKGTLFELLDAEGRIGVRLTETFAMEPAASVCGWLFANPESRYFNVGRIDHDQVVDYARRKGISVAEAERRLAPNLVSAARAERPRGSA